MKYILDLTAADLPEIWPDCARILPVQLGEYEKDFDLVESKIDQKTLHELRLLIIRRTMQENPKANISILKPIGFSLNRMPVGATIYRIE